MILAHVGAGKTATTLTAMRDMLKDGVAKRFLVLAPKRVCTHVWPVELPKWAPDCTMAVAVGTPSQRKAALGSGAQIIVSNYDCIQWLALQNLSHIDGIVFDELTRLKNPSGARFKALNKVIGQFKIRWGLTGSFTSNGLEDVFGQCKIIDQTLLGRSKGAFLQQYFVLLNKEYGDWAPRKGALAQVMAKLKPATFVLESAEYKDKLPQLHTVEMRCDMADRKPYETMKKDFVLNGVAAVNAAVVTGKLQQLAAGFLYDTKVTASDVPGKFTTTQTPIWYGTHKFDMLDDLIQENQHANSIVAYNYKEELAELKRRYPKAWTLDDTGAIEQWNAGNVELLLVHPKSASHGLNLQAGGSCIIFLSLPWSLELYEQTIGRLHRGGQTRDVWCYVLFTNKTVDDKIWTSLYDKRSLSDIAMEELCED